MAISGQSHSRLLQRIYEIYMKLLSKFTPVLLALLSIPAFAADGKWTEGFGQGNYEYFIDDQGWRLHIGCPTQNGSADAYSSVSVYRIVDNAPAKVFSLTVGGMTFEGPFEANSRAGDSNFLAVLQNLRKGDAVVTLGAKSLTYPKSNAAKVLPVYGKMFVCNLDM